MRSCQRGFWRFFPDRPDILTPGYHYFSPEGTASIQAPHSFGSAGWLKDGMTYPVFPTGQVWDAGVEWYDGQEPTPIPPDQQIFDDAAFAQNLTWPVVPPVQVRNGFDARCFVVGHPGVDIDVDEYLRPDVTDCCWQRVIARLLELMSSGDPADLTLFRDIVAELWPDYTLTIFPLDTVVDRWALIVGPTFQILLRVGTQSWNEIFIQVFHGFQRSRNFGPFATSAEWFGASTDQNGFLNAIGWNPDKPCVFAGHSRGAAILWILARRMMNDNRARVIDFLSFGCPKVGDERMVDDGGIRFDRHVTHRLDPIPLLPPPIGLFEFLHVLAPFLSPEWLVSWQNFSVYQIVGDGWGNQMRPAGSLAPETYFAMILSVWAGRAVNPIAQHFLKEYVAALLECCPQPGYPFTPFIRALLFGFVSGSAGGLMIGPRQWEPWTTGSSGLAIGGGTPTPAGSGGLAIGGGGTDVYTTTPAIIQEDDSFILLETGDLILKEG